MKIETAVNMACLWEATAAKPGNVNRSNDFHDTTLVDFLASAAATAPVFRSCKQLSVGELVLKAVTETRRLTSSNTNLGIILLLAPLAKSFSREEFDPSGGFQKRLSDWKNVTGELLESLCSKQADLICQAIEAANPGGLGERESNDVRDGSNGLDVISLMALAENHDLIAWQFTHQFETVFQEVAPKLNDFLQKNYPVQLAIIGTFLHTLAKHPDSLIARKNGDNFAKSVSARAGQLCDLWQVEPVAEFSEFQGRQELLWKEIADFDFFLRSDENRRNPGTTADLIAAGLFVLLCLDQVSFPIQW